MEDLRDFRRSLAHAYLNLGLVEKAIEVLEHLISTDKAALLSEDDPELLSSQDELAYCYAKNGEDQRATELMKHIVRVQRRTLHASPVVGSKMAQFFIRELYMRPFAQHLSKDQDEKTSAILASLLEDIRIDEGVVDPMPMIGGGVSTVTTPPGDEQQQQQQQ
ncbi:hypothetical protein F4778DRAFT_784821 [Xylariomycetidae sp. FL2044]|nr:hypothetical protein F4778DRAFT_784821 [Xylariomycetidae sp. FL2044]